MHMHAHAYMGACCTNDPKLRDTLSKPLMGMPQYSGRPCKSHQYAYIYIYIYINMCVCVCALQAYTSGRFRIEWYKRTSTIGFKSRKYNKQFMSFK